MSVVGSIWVRERPWCLLPIGVSHLKSAVWVKIYREGAQVGKSNTFCIGSYCTAGSFCLLVISHCSNKKKDVSLRVYLFAKEGQVSSRPEIWPWTVLSLSAACQPVLPKLSCRNACLCIAWPLCTVLPSLFSVLRIHACSFTWQVLDYNQHWALAVVPVLLYLGLLGHGGAVPHGRGERKVWSCCCWHLLSQLACAPWLVLNTHLLAELFVWACLN